METEYGYAVHCYTEDSGAMIGGDVIARVAGGKVVVVTGGGGPNRRMADNIGGKYGWGRCQGDR